MAQWGAARWLNFAWPAMQGAFIITAGASAVKPVMRVAPP
jgi:hypothetical protein